MYTISKEYEDFLGNQRKEDFRFNLTKSEILNFYTSENGDLRTILINMLQHQDSAKMMKLMSQLIDISYGEISPDGRRFDKSPEILNNFKATNAYSDIYTELSTDPEKFKKFLLGVMPKELASNFDGNVPEDVLQALPSSYRKALEKTGDNK